MLLWHGSRLTNWTGILSQGHSFSHLCGSFLASCNNIWLKHGCTSSGLRIAPPEAPVTGYMFGKGVYFADMFSKSANYCYPTPTAADGVLLLCEVVFCLIVNFVALLIDLRKEWRLKLESWIPSNWFVMSNNIR
jgi:poly [ADP-ribose] polymerase